ncbi:hypothetical protein RCL1_003711 [Eukaryota sp. TZLM3-RCL]
MCSTVIAAAHFASLKHRDQRRKDTIKTPYVNHVLDVAKILSIEANITDPNVLAAALLHDTIEDTDCSFDELVTSFGSKIASIVMECTDDKNLPKSERKRLQIETASKKSTEAKLVKLADKLSNLRSIVAGDYPQNWPLERILEYFSWAKRVTDNLKGVSPVLEGLLQEIYQSSFSFEGCIYPTISN